MAGVGEQNQYFPKPTGVRFLNYVLVGTHIIRGEAMDLNNLNIRYITYIIAGFGVVGAVGAFGGANSSLAPVLAIMYLLGAGLSIAVFKFGYFLFPLITSRTKHVQIMQDNFEIPPAQDVIIKQSGSLYYASAYLGVRIYESTSEKTPEENMVYSEYFERAISSVRFPVKFAMMVCVLDMSNERLKWETRLAEARLKLGREREKPDPDVLKLDRFEKEVGHVRAAIAPPCVGFQAHGRHHLCHDHRHGHFQGIGGSGGENAGSRAEGNARQRPQCGSGDAARG